MLFLDLEVYSEVDLSSNPIEVYASHPSTKIILACTAVDDRPVKVWKGKDIPEFLSRLRRTKETLNAWNVGFERTVLKYQGVGTGLDRWVDTMVLARQLGLPGGLKQCCKVPQIRMPEHAATKSETLLIKKFCTPRKPVAKHNPQRDADDWQLFIDYCRRDVESQRHIYKYVVANFPPEAAERRVWELDQVINERGVPIDIVTARFAENEVARLTGEVRQKLSSLTGLPNPNSTQQLLPWLKERGYPYDSLGKEFVQQAIDREEARLAPEAYECLSLRLSAAKASVKKFSALVQGTSPDRRLRHQFKYYGAHTGRWSGRGFQPQNLTRTSVPAPVLEKFTGHERMESLDELSLCIRPCIAAGPGKKLAVADLSAIEHRIVMWLSGCEAGLRVHTDNRDPYKDFATRMYGIEYDQVDKQQRQICKPPVLGCGYGLGAGQERHLANGQIELTGLRAYARSMGVLLSHEQSVNMVYMFRRAFEDVPKLWRYCEQAFYAAVNTGNRQRVGALYFGVILSQSNHVEVEAAYVELPSGRRIYYMNPRAWNGPKGIECRFDGLRNGMWWTIPAWGGVFTENIVQAVSRDVLVEGMMRCEEAGLPVVLHCHDELVAEVDESYPAPHKTMERLMSAPVSWAEGLPLSAEGWEGLRYGKN